MDEIEINEKNKDWFFTNYVQKRVPVLIKNGVTEWPLMKKWSKDYIIRQFGNYIYTVVKDSRSGVASNNNIKTSLQDYFANHQDGSAFLREVYDKKFRPLFFEDIELPNNFFSETDIASYFFYHAPESGGALPHKHPFEVFNMLQQGEKKWVLFDAHSATSAQGDLLIQHYKEEYGPNTLSKDWFKNELPVLSKKISPLYECNQKAGDIVYIPTQFCHAVLNMSEVMGLIVEVLR
jgi:ribosomal protein L16 Arg81 hydroxylase